ncbi:MAG: sulfite exporter TauE/SafE family protein [Spirochaetales bacterium]|nr:sulfite exporter TauE/SafE family protein [Spirochaetales bacterium]
MLWIVAATTLAASFISGLSGFGFGLIAMALLPLLIGIRMANAFVSFCSLTIFATLTIPLRAHIAWKALLPMLAGTAVGVPIGVYALVNLPEGLLLKILAGFILSYVCFALFVQNRAHFHMDRRWGYLVGLASGLISGALSSGGPPVIMYCDSLELGKKGFKATLQMYFVLMVLYKIPIFYIAGLLTGELWRNLLYYSPFVAAGTVGGVLLFHRLSELWFRRIVLLLLTAVAVLLIAKS